MYFSELSVGEERESQPAYWQWYLKQNHRCSRALLGVLGSKSDLKIGKLHRAGLLLMIITPLGLEIMCAVEDRGVWEWGAATHFELMLLAIVMYLFTNFDEPPATAGGARRFRFREMLACSVPVVLLGIGFGRKVMNKRGFGFEGSLEVYSHVGYVVNDLGRLVLVAIAMTLVYKSKSVALKLLSLEDKQNVVQNLCFRNGFLGVMPPVLYVGAELSGCMLRYSVLYSHEVELTGAVVYENCSGLFAGSKAVTMHLVALFYVSVSFAQ
jgi:hypothetical protein